MVAPPDRSGPPGDLPRPPLPEEEYRAVYGRVPRLTVEVVVVGPDGVLLTLREDGPCTGLWHLPGGTVRWGEPVVDAVRRVARSETGLDVAAGPLLGVIEYPSHVAAGIDSPVGLAHLCPVDVTPAVRDGVVHGWFRHAPEPMHAEQVTFLRAHALLGGPAG